MTFGTRSVVPYSHELPEILDRDPYSPPRSHLKKVSGDRWEVVEGRRPSRILVVNKLRKAVDEWRSAGYPGASEVSRHLFRFWFEEAHLTADGAPFRFYFGQREAMETLAYLVEVEKASDIWPLMQKFGEVMRPEDVSRLPIEGDKITMETTSEGKRYVRRYIPESEGVSQQELPPEGLRRFAFKMATGSGKTVVMAMAAVWAYFHKKKTPGSSLSSNFLIIAPNVIVYQRLERDFQDGRIFYKLPLIPPEWKHEWNLKVVLRDDPSEPSPSGTLFLTNIQQIYVREEEQSDNPVQALLGPKGKSGGFGTARPLLERIFSLPDLIVMNDEAHHVHREDLAWSRTLFEIDERLPSGLSLWLDFSATPKDQNGSYFPWIICDYPLAQAVEDCIVKAPLIVHEVDREDPEQVTRGDVIANYREWLEVALKRWKEHRDIYQQLGQKPVLFIMTEKNVYADEIGEWLVEQKGFKPSEVLVIHTDKEGEIKQADLEKARRAAREIDNPRSRVKIIVSVLMLREGWDVRNVTVVLGLRPFTSKARILPEQAVGRGLRLMWGISPDKTQTLEVIGTRAFEEFVKELEKEGVGVPTVKKPPKPPIVIRPVKEKLEYDIELPLTAPKYTRSEKDLDKLDLMELPALREGVPDEKAIKIEIDHGITETKVHDEEIRLEDAPIFQDTVALIVREIMRVTHLPGVFSKLYPIVERYLKERAFGCVIDPDDPRVRSYLSLPSVRQRATEHFVKEINRLTVKKKDIEFEEEHFRLSQTKEFVWRRQYISCNKTVFNYTPVYNDFEGRFAEFLDKCEDVKRFAALAEHFTRFKVDYLKKSGALAFYYPDWVVVQEMPEGEVYWIVETKGREWEDTVSKDATMEEWCRRISELQGKTWRYMRVNEKLFGDGKHFKDFASLVSAVEKSGQSTLVEM